MCICKVQCCQMLSVAFLVRDHSVCCAGSDTSWRYLAALPIRNAVTFRRAKSAIQLYVALDHFSA